MTLKCSDSGVRFRGGVKLTVQGTNMDVVLNSKMVVTVVIRKHADTSGDYGQGDEYPKNYHPVVRHIISLCCTH